MSRFREGAEIAGYSKLRYFFPGFFFLALMKELYSENSSESVRSAYLKGCLKDRKTLFQKHFLEKEKGKRRIVVNKVKKADVISAYYEQIFERYLDICNQAIEKNKETLPCIKLWKERWKNTEHDKILHCAIYDDRPKIVYTLQLADDMTLRIIAKTHNAPPNAWPFKYSDLRHVVEDPQHYIEHPEDLDWDWLSRGIFR